MATTPAAAPVGFLSLPIELRLQIINYVLEQDPNAGFTQSPQQEHGRPKLYYSLWLDHHSLRRDPNYSSAAHLNILLVCRQFRHDFTNVAFRSTVFVVRDGFSYDRQRLQRHQLENLRNLVLITKCRLIREVADWLAMWNKDIGACQLDKLTIVLRPQYWDHLRGPMREMVAILRQLERIKSLKFVATLERFRLWYNQLIGFILKRDHCWRYDARGAPHIETTWWDWNFNSDENTFELISRPPKPMLPEADDRRCDLKPCIGCISDLGRGESVGHPASVL